jgi:hypothetical protein
VSEWTVIAWYRGENGEDHDTIINTNTERDAMREARAEKRRGATRVSIFCDGDRFETLGEEQ